MKTTVKATLFLVLFFPFASFGGGDNTENTTNASFLSFNTNINDQHIDLQWETRHEANIKNFTIEKSRDGESFTAVAIIPASKKSIDYMKYFDIDYDVWKEKTYYRIKQTDNNGTMSYSKIVAITYLGTNGEKIENQNGFAKQKQNTMGETFILVKNKKGEKFYSKFYVSKNKKGSITASNALATPIPKGRYLVIAADDNRLFGKNIIVQY